MPQNYSWNSGYYNYTPNFNMNFGMNSYYGYNNFNSMPQLNFGGWNNNYFNNMPFNAGGANCFNIDWSNFFKNYAGSSSTAPDSSAATTAPTAKTNLTYSEYEDTKRQLNEKKQALEEEKNNIAVPLEDGTQLSAKDVKQQEQEFEQLKKNGLQEDGSIKVETKLKDASFGQKALAVGGSVFTGAMKLATDFFAPKDENGKFSWKKLAKNVLITAGCVALTAIPVVGPIASAAMLASGVVAGGIGIARGVKNAAKLNGESTLEDLRHASEDITVGAAVAVASARGLKGISKSAGTASGNFFKDMTVNAFKGTVKNVQADKAMISSLRTQQNMSLSKALFNGTKENISKLWNSCASKDSFDKKYKDVYDAQTNKINELNTKISTETDPAKKAMLELERDGLKDINGQLSRTKTKADWKNLAKTEGNESMLAEFKTNLNKYKADFIKKGEVEINGHKFNYGNAADKQMFEETIASLEKEFFHSGWSKLKFWGSKDDVMAQLEVLAKQRKTSINELSLKTLSKSGKHKPELIEYYGNKNWWLRAFSNIGAAFTPKKAGFWRYTGQALKTIAWDAPMLPFKYGQAICKNAGAAGYEWETILSPVYSLGMLGNGSMSAEEVAQREEEIKAKKEVIEQASAQYDEAIKQYDEAIKNTTFVV